jgi:hypothetical protein
MRRSASNMGQHCKCIIASTTRQNSSVHKRGGCEQSKATRDNRCTKRGRSHITGLWYSCHHWKGSNPLDEMWNWKGLKPITRLQVLPGPRVKIWFTPLAVTLDRTVWIELSRDRIKALGACTTSDHVSATLRVTIYKIHELCQWQRNTVFRSESVNFKYLGSKNYTMYCVTDSDGCAATRKWNVTVYTA